MASTTVDAEALVVEAEYFGLEDLVKNIIHFTKDVFWLNVGGTRFTLRPASLDYLVPIRKGFGSSTREKKKRKPQKGTRLLLERESPSSSERSVRSLHLQQRPGHVRSHSQLPDYGEMPKWDYQVCMVNQL
jgi:hypothetical protein